MFVQSFPRLAVSILVSVLASDLLAWQPPTEHVPAIEPGVPDPIVGSELSQNDAWWGAGPFWQSEAPTRMFFGSGEAPTGGPRPVQIPEPLLFDMVRPLGPNRGDYEFNTLAIFPWRARGGVGSDDPFGPGPSTRDRGGIEWAPEVEIALSDRFAVEFELPFEGSVLEELKLGLQWTFGTAFGNRYIHGVQVLIEPTPQFETWSSTLLYLGGLRFNETWSTLIMFGGRMDLEGGNNPDSVERLFNASLFAEINEWLTLGLETNTATRLNGEGNFILVPQAHIELSRCLEVQSGLGLGAESDGYELSAILRVIYAP